MSFTTLLWIVGIVVFFVIAIWLIIQATFQVERNDQRRGRRDLDQGGFIDPDAG